jgi:hypothetical protein
LVGSRFAEGSLGEKNKEAIGTKKQGDVSEQALLIRISDTIGRITGFFCKARHVPAP